MERLLLNLIRLRGNKELSFSEWQLLEEDIRKMGFEIHMPSGLKVSEVFKEGISKVKGLNCSEIYSQDLKNKVGELYFSVSEKGDIKIERYVPNRPYIVIDGKVLYDFGDKYFDASSWQLIEKEEIVKKEEFQKMSRISKDSTIRDLIEVSFALACEFERTDFPKITTVSKIAQEMLIALIYSHLIEVDELE